MPLRDAIFASSFALVPVPATADEFCDALTTIVAAADTGFSDLRGAQDPQTPARYDGNLSLPGATGNGLTPPCSVHDNGAGDVTYGCGFPGINRTSEVELMMSAFNARVAGCLNVEPPLSQQLNRPDGPYIYELERSRVVTFMSWGPHGGDGRMNIVISPRR